MGVGVVVTFVVGCCMCVLLVWCMWFCCVVGVACGVFGWVLLCWVGCCYRLGWVWGGGSSFRGGVEGCGGLAGVRASGGVVLGVGVVDMLGVHALVV